ncbi:hypothetical protein ACVIGA_003095 [Bradyrhizobium sp. USDA 3240]
MFAAATIEGFAAQRHTNSTKLPCKGRQAQQIGHGQRHQQRGDQRIQAHRDPGKDAGDLVDLEGARGADAMGGDAGGKAAGTKIRDAGEVHQWRDDDRTHDAGEDHRDRRQRGIGMQGFADAHRNAGRD